MKSVLTRDQKKIENVTVKNSKLYPEFNGMTLKIKIRYDDECGNGHNSFSITGSCGNRRIGEIGGCVHDFITEQAPHLKNFLKWHLTSSDGPMYYLANSLYHAKEVKKDTIVSSYEESLKFKDFPFTFSLNKRLLDFIKEYEKGAPIAIFPLVHDGGDYDFSDNFTFDESVVRKKKCWYESMFSKRKEAEEMAEALMSLDFEIVQTVNRYESEKKADLNAARNSAIWPDAELKDFTKERLEARLPKILKEFEADMIELGFTF